MSDEGPTNRVTVHLTQRDGVALETLTVERRWYEPPMIWVQDGAYYVRTSPDAVENPLTFKLEPRVWLDADRE